MEYSFSPDALRSRIRPTACTCLINPDGMVFIGASVRYAPYYTMPQGGRFEQDPDMAHAAARELKEEINVAAAVTLAALSQEVIYDYPRCDKDSKWTCQEQSWFFKLFHGDEKDIHFHNTNPPEFHSGRWATPDEVLRLAPPDRMKGYGEVIDGLLPILRAMTILPPPDSRKAPVSLKEACAYRDRLRNLLPLAEADNLVLRPAQPVFTPAAPVLSRA